VGPRAQPGPAGAGRVVKRGNVAEDHGIGKLCIIVVLYIVKVTGTNSSDAIIMYLYRSYVENLRVRTVPTPAQYWSYVFHIVGYFCVF